jgi:hypothetical protein
MTKQSENKATTITTIDKSKQTSAVPTKDELSEQELSEQELEKASGGVGKGTSIDILS